MNPDTPQTPREQLEMRVTALLLGELTAEEATALREVIARDPQLAALEERLMQTIALVRETAASPAEEMATQPAPLKMSAARREQLLAKFKTVTPKEFVRPRVLRHLKWLIPMSAAAAVMLLLATLSIPNFSRARSTAKANAIINNLRQLDGAKQQWALELKTGPDAVPTMSQITRFMGRGSDGAAPQPVAGEKYVVGKIGEPPSIEMDAKEARKLANTGLAVKPSATPGKVALTFGDVVTPDLVMELLSKEHRFAGAEAAKPPATATTPATQPQPTVYDANVVGYVDVPLTEKPTQRVRTAIVLPSTTDAAETAAEKPITLAMGREPADARINRFYTGTTSDDVGGLRNMYRQTGEANSLEALVEQNIQGNVNKADSFAVRRGTRGQIFGGTSNGGNDHTAGVQLGTLNGNFPTYGFDSAGKADGNNLNSTLAQAGSPVEANKWWADPRGLTESEKQLVTRTIRVDPKTFEKGLEGVVGIPFGASGDGIAMGGSGGAGGGGGFGVGGGGTRFATGSSNSAAVTEGLARNYLVAAGVNINDKVGKSMTYDGRTGELTFRGTAQDLALIEQATKSLGDNNKPVELRTEFATVTPNNVDLERLGQANQLATDQTKQQLVLGSGATPMGPLGQRTPAKGVNWTGTLQAEKFSFGNNPTAPPAAVPAAQPPTVAAKSIVTTNGAQARGANLFAVTQPGINAPIVSAPITYDPTAQSQAVRPAAGTPATPQAATPGNRVGDPEWIGLLDQPAQQRTSSNRFVARYAYQVSQPELATDFAGISNQQTALAHRWAFSESNSSTLGGGAVAQPDLVAAGTFVNSGRIDTGVEGTYTKLREAAAQPDSVNPTGLYLGTYMPTPPSGIPGANALVSPSTPDGNGRQGQRQVNTGTIQGLAGSANAQSVDKVARLGDTPALGWAFRQSEASTPGKTPAVGGIVQEDAFSNYDYWHWGTDETAAHGTAAKNTVTVGAVEAKRTGEFRAAHPESTQNSDFSDVSKSTGQPGLGGLAYYRDLYGNGRLENGTVKDANDTPTTTTQNQLALVPRSDGKFDVDTFALGVKVNEDFNPTGYIPPRQITVANAEEAGRIKQLVSSGYLTSDKTIGDLVEKVRSDTVNRQAPAVSAPSLAGPTSGTHVIQLKNADPADVKQIISDLFAQNQPTVQDHEKESVTRGERTEIVLPAGTGTKRDYPNSTSAGPVQATYDPQTGKFVVITDDKTFDSVDLVLKSVDRPTNAPQQLAALNGRPVSVDEITVLQKRVDRLAREPAVKSVDTAIQVQNGRVYLEAGLLDDAEATLKKALVTDPQSYSALHYLELVQEQRANNANLRGELAVRKSLVQVESDWDVEQRNRQKTPQSVTDAGRDAINAAKLREAIAKDAARASNTNELLALENRVNDLRRKLNVVDTDPNSSGPGSTLGPMNVVQLNGIKVQAEQQATKERANLDALKKLDENQLKETLPRLTADPILRQLLEESKSVDAQLGQSRTRDLDPKVRSNVELKNKLDGQIKEQVAANLKAMETKVKTLESQAEQAQRQLDQAKSNNIQVTEATRPYWEAKAELDKMRAQVQELAQHQTKPAVKADTDPVVPKPASPPPIPQPEVLVRENAFSTFSLNVSDVSFKLAAATLEKGTLPEPGNVRAEEFINAFDYRDPEPTAAAAVGFAWERAHYPFAHNRDLLRFSLKTAAAGRQANRPLNIVLLLDNSGSMERADRVEIIHEALRVLASQLKPQDRVSVITFSRLARLWVDGIAGNQAGDVLNHVGNLTPEGGTNLEEAMRLAYATALRHYFANGMNRVVLLTDGAANLGNVNPDALKQMVETQRKQGVALDCFGIGWEGYNDDLLEVLSRNGDGRYGFINSADEAATEFAGQLAGALQVAASDVKVQVEFNPKRVTSYRQIGYAKHQLKKEQFRDNTVDAAEIAAAEAGNALYTVEVNPAGEGPIATVRARYKTPGTSNYYEKEWAVPYNGPAVDMERASPAIRLAGASAAFAEWLAQSPFAAEVTPGKLLNELNGVTEVYGVDPRPKQLETMIRQSQSVSGQ